MTNSPSLLVILRSIEFDVPDGASHVIINDYSEPTRVAFVMVGPAAPVTRDLSVAEQARVIEALELHRRSRYVAMRVDR